MKSKEITVGKFTLETLTLGMYKNPLIIYREYIQNAADSIDQAIKDGLIKSDDALIKVNIDHEKHNIVIQDNGTGVLSDEVYNVLCDIGNARKDYRVNKGFRGIGRLGGLAYCEKLVFKTSFKGEDVASIITWDAVTLKKLLHPDNKEATDLFDVVNRIVTQDVEDEDIDAHYFIVKMESVHLDHRNTLLNDKTVQDYLSEVAPVPYDYQKFKHGMGISEAFKESNHRFDEYKVIFNDSKIPIKKPYKTSFITGNIEKNKKNDNVLEVKIIDDEKRRYSGWIAITNFYGSIRDLSIRGIRLRKGNILIGDASTFNQFFLAEKDVANSWLMGEIFIHDPEIIPNSQRDDFEPNEAFFSLKESLTEIAEKFRKQYRRDMSEYNSAIKQVQNIQIQLNKIQEELETNGVTSDQNREQLLEEKEKLETNFKKSTERLAKLEKKKEIYEDKKHVIKKVQKDAEQIEADIIKLENNIINARYATKHDLPSSYSKEVRKVYERIIAVIDTYFANDKETAKELREKIIEELAITKKRKKR